MCRQTLSAQRSKQFSERVRKTVSFEKQIMLNKYPSIFSHLVEAIVFIILIFFTTHPVLKIGEDLTIVH